MTFYSEHAKERREESRESPRWIVLAPREVPRKKCKDTSSTPTSVDHRPELLSLTQILQVIDCVMGLNQRSAMLLLLKMKRSKRIIPQQIAQEDDSIQQFYNVGNLLEIICQVTPFDEILENLARKASKSKEEILMNMRGLFRSEFLITIERGNYVLINDLGRLPLKYQEALLRIRKDVLKNIEGFLSNAESLTPSRTEVARTFNSLLEGILWFCAILEPDMETEDQISCVASLDRIQMSDRRTRGEYIGRRSSLEVDTSRKVS